MGDIRTGGDHDAYLAAVGRMVRAAGRRIGDADPCDLMALRLLSQQVDDVLADAVARQRLAGHSWQAIADGLGITRQAAHKQYARLVALREARELAPVSPP